MSDPTESGQTAPTADLPLGAMQQWFQAVVTHPDGVKAGEGSHAAQSIAEGEHTIDRLLTRSNALDAASRISVYADAYFARLIECLGEVFPMMRKLLGPEVFEGFAFEYLQDTPSRSYTLHHLGRQFPEWLARSRSDPESIGATVSAANGPDWPDLLVDLARFEWAIYDVFDGPGVEGQPTLRAEDLAGLAPEVWAHVRLRLAPCLQLLALRFPVNTLYTALRQAGEGEAVPLPDAEPSWVALNRRSFVVQRHTLEQAGHELLAAIMNDRPLDEALEAAAAVWTGSDEDLASALRQWFHDWSADDFFLAVEGGPEGGGYQRRDQGDQGSALTGNKFTVNHNNEGHLGHSR